MAKVKDSLSSYVELGAKLRQLRLDAGLSITEMVRRMNHNRGFVSRIGRLEQGRLKQPSLALVADYLRVLGKSISELAPVLDQYTSKPVPLEVAGRERVKAFLRSQPPKVAAQLDSYDVKTSVARRFSGEPPLEPDEREMRIRKQAQMRYQRGMLDERLRGVMLNLGAEATSLVRRFAFDYGHKVWRILRTTREDGKVHRRAKSREQRLAEAEAKTLKQGMIPIEGLQVVRRRVEKLFEEMDMTGGIDFLPSFEQAHKIGKPFSVKYKNDGKGGKMQRLVQSQPYDARFAPSAHSCSKELVDASVEDKSKRLRWYNWSSCLWTTALETEPGSEERRRRTEEKAAETSRPDLALKLAERYYEEFERWRRRIFRLGPAPKQP